MDEGFRYDVFLSHSSKDAAVVRPLAEQLRAEGLRVWLDEWVLRPGDHVLATIEDGLEHSRVLVLCMSANASASDWTQFEAGAFRFRDPLNRARRFVPVRLDDAPISGSLAQFLYVDFRSGRGAALQDLLAAIRSEIRSSVLHRPDWLTMPERQWRGSPGALLRADLAVVPFHGRETELAALMEWALADDDGVAQLVTGPGGMGKTRLARELCEHLGQKGILAGYLDLHQREQCLAAVRAGTLGRTVVVVDYAETVTDDLAAVLRAVAAGNRMPVRFLLLARGAGYWWQELRRKGGGIDDCLRAEPLRLGALAMDVPARRASFRLAAAAFAQRLGVADTAVEPADVGAEDFERALVLHMSALLSLEGVHAQGTESILETVLDREAGHWAQQLKGRQIPNLGRGFERAMGVISAYGGVRDKVEALEVIRSIGFFSGQPMAVLEAVAEALHDCYPGTSWIEPVQPDLLMEHLIAKATRDDPDLFQKLLLPV